MKYNNINRQKKKKVACDKLLLVRLLADCSIIMRIFTPFTITLGSYSMLCSSYAQLILLTIYAALFLSVEVI